MFKLSLAAWTAGNALSVWSPRHLRFKNPPHFLRIGHHPYPCLRHILQVIMLFADGFFELAACSAADEPKIRAPMEKRSRKRGNRGIPPLLCFPRASRFLINDSLKRFSEFEIRLLVSTFV